MSSGDSISRFIQQVKEGDDEAAAAIWEHCFAELVQLARRKLIVRRDPMADEEDIAISVFESFCRAAEAGRFADLKDREGLGRNSGFGEYLCVLDAKSR